MEDPPYKGDERIIYRFGPVCVRNSSIHLADKTQIKPIDINAVAMCTFTEFAQFAFARSDSRTFAFTLLYIPSCLSLSLTLVYALLYVHRAFGALITPFWHGTETKQAAKMIKR